MAQRRVPRDEDEGDDEDEDEDEEGRALDDPEAQA